MGVELADAKSSLKATADELGITPQILTRWCREQVAGLQTDQIIRLIVHNQFSNIFLTTNRINANQRTFYIQAL